MRRISFLGTDILKNLPNIPEFQRGYLIYITPSITRNESVLKMVPMQWLHYSHFLEIRVYTEKGNSLYLLERSLKINPLLGYQQSETLSERQNQK